MFSKKVSKVKIKSFSVKCVLNFLYNIGLNQVLLC